MESITIIMATYNGERYLMEQIKSIMESDYPNILLRIYDDGSIDKSIDIINECINQYPGKIFLCKNEANLGVAKNFLNALTQVDTEFAMFADQDDVWLKDKVSKTLAHMKQVKDYQKKPVAVFTDAYVTDENLNVLGKSFHKSNHLNTDRLSLGNLMMENKLIGCTVMVNYPLIKLIKDKPIPKYVRYHDWWVGLVAASFGTVSYLKEPTIYYRQHQGNVVGNQKFLSYIKRRLRAYDEIQSQLLLCERQAGELYQQYRGELSDHLREVQIFAELSHYSFFKRRYYMIKYKFYKSGLIRNIGAFIFL